MTITPAHTWDWLPARLWQCPRCHEITATREAAARCPFCGFKEDE